MKRVILSFAVVLCASVAFATISPSVGATISVHQEDKVKIDAQALPEAVKTTLNGEEYKEWTVTAAYHIKTNDQYEVELKKGEETKTVKLDKDGKAV